MVLNVHGPGGGLSLLPLEGGTQRLLMPCVALGNGGDRRPHANTKHRYSANHKTHIYLQVCTTHSTPQHSTHTIHATTHHTQHKQNTTQYTTHNTKKNIQHNTPHRDQLDCHGLWSLLPKSINTIYAGTWYWVPGISFQFCLSPWLYQVPGI